MKKTKNEKLNDTARTVTTLQYITGTTVILLGIVSAAEIISYVSNIAVRNPLLILTSVIIFSGIEIFLFAILLEKLTKKYNSLLQKQNP